MQKINRHAFTMIELVFVIVVLGILAGVAVPKLAATRDDAEIAKIRSDVASIRSAIVSERQIRLLRGEVQYISALDQGVASNTDKVALFDGNDTTHILLQYPIFTSRQSANTPTSGKWLKKGTNNYIVSAGGTLTEFRYYPTTNGIHKAGSFKCMNIIDNDIANDDTNDQRCLSLLR